MSRKSTTASRLASHISTKRTPQNEPIPGAVGQRQVENSAGGFVFAVDKWTRLVRFLILGSDGGSYYATERALTRENAQCVMDCASEDFTRTLRTVVEVSDQGRAPKNDAALLALALLCTHEAPKSTEAFAELRKVARIGTHLFQFVEMLSHLRGRGRAFRRALQSWYTDQDPRQVAFQVTKYAQRNQWSHRDILRLVKPKTDDAAMDAVFAYVVGKDWKGKMPDCPAKTYLEAVDAMKRAETKTQVVNLIREYNLPREVIPTQHLNSCEVWEALLERMPPGALVRNLGKMASIGLTKPMSTASGTVCAKLADGEWLCKARLHPLAVLVALGIYRSGHGLRGKLSWAPDSNIIDSLDAAFYACFGGVVPSGKRHLLAIDISGSMTSPNIANTYLSPRDAAAAMAMVTVNVEPQTHVCAFASAGGGRWGRSPAPGGSHWTCPANITPRYRWSDTDGISPVPLSKKSRLDDAVRQIGSLPPGGTDCALPMIYALQRKIETDVFVVYTDSETWAGSVHPVQALRDYRQQMGIPAKLIVVGLVSNNFTIADPNDSGMMDVVGFDTSAPAVMADFARG